MARKPTGMPNGRPAKPTILKVLHGDAPSRTNQHEPIPTADAEFRPPIPLSTPALAIWDKLAHDMRDKGVFTNWDANAFAELCETFVLLRATRMAAMREVADGCKSASAMLAYQRAFLSMMSGCSRFGMTPSDRTRLVTSVELRHDPTADLLSG